LALEIPQAVLEHWKTWKPSGVRRVTEEEKEEMRRLREEEGLSYYEIGRRIGRHHSVVRRSVDSKARADSLSYTWNIRHFEGTMQGALVKLQRLRRHQAGFCEKCPLPRVTLSYCREHATKQNGYSIFYQQKKVHKGLCRVCTELRVTTLYCRYHADRENKRNKTRRRLTNGS